jgi:tetratricopeptide (TPR) repeat protein
MVPFYNSKFILGMNSKEELLKALKNKDPKKRNLATKALWSLWHGEAGESAELKLSQGTMLMNSKKFNQAEEIFTSLVSEFPDFAEAHNKLATLFYLESEYLKSVEECKIVLSLNPHHFGTWNGMGLCLFNLGKYNEAIQSFQRALDVQPFATVNQVYIARCLGNLN